LIERERDSERRHGKMSRQSQKTFPSEYQQITYMLHKLSHLTPERIASFLWNQCCNLQAMCGIAAQVLKKAKVDWGYDGIGTSIHPFSPKSAKLGACLAIQPDPHAYDSTSSYRIVSVRPDNVSTTTVWMFN
jgi:hypothetical protein